MAGPTTSYSNWDFYNYHIQEDLQGGQFISAESTLVAAGPPQLSSAPNVTSGSASPAVYPIGLLESVGLQQSKQLQRIFEIGSTRSYFIPGRVVGSLSIGRTFYFGPSLLRVLYAYYNTTTDWGSLPVGTMTQIDGKTISDPNAALLDGTDPATLHQVMRTPGEGYFFIDLASDMFNQPTGMAIYFKDQNAVSVGAMYLENSYVQGHQMSISSGSVLVMEGVSMQYDQIVPIKVMDS